MPLESADLSVSLLLLIALVLVRGFEKQIKAVSARSYDNIAGGIAVLAIAAVARLYHTSGLLEPVPFLSETVFFDLAYWIGILTGATFVISGVADWLPLARNYRRYHQHRVEHLDLLRKVEQLVGVENRINAVLATALQYIIDQMSFSGGAVYKCSYSRRLLTLEATVGEFATEPQTLNQVSLNPEAVWAARQAIDPHPSAMLTNLPEEMDKPLATLPIMVGRRPVGFFVLWGDRVEGVDPDDLRTLRLVTDVIARKIERDRLTLKNRAQERDQVWRERLEIAMSKSGDTRRRFALLAENLAEHISFDQVSLIVIDHHTMRARRYSWGAAGRVLVETGLAWPPSGNLVAAAVRSGQLTAFHDLDESVRPELAGIFTGEKVKSLLVAPFLSGGRLTSVLMLDSAQRAVFCPSIQRQVRALASLVNTVIWPDLQADTRREENVRLQTLRRLQATITTETESETMLEQAALAISNETESDLVRVSVLDDSGSFLESRALITTTSHTDIIPANGQMILSVMPLHEQVMNSGVPVILDETTIEAAMLGIERRQALVASVRSVLLAPLMHGDRVVGMITTGSFSGESLDRTSQTFVMAVADLLAVALDSPDQPARTFEIPIPDPVARRTELPARPTLNGFFDSARRIDLSVTTNQD